MAEVFSENGIRIVHDDFLTTNYISDNSIDLIVTSPPYNLEIKYNVFNDNIEYIEYLKFTEQWLIKAYSLMKEDGRMCMNIVLDKSKGRKGSGFIPIYADIVNIAKKVGWQYFSTIVWTRGNIARSTAWGSWLSASAPFVTAHVEVIIVFYKKKWKKTTKGISDITKEEFIQWTNGLWTFPPESKKVGHPAPFPIELPKRCIKLFSYVDDLILDPFMGSGTTLIACNLLHRKGIGIDIDENYCKISIDRLREKGRQRQLF